MILKYKKSFLYRMAMAFFLVLSYILNEIYGLNIYIPGQGLYLVVIFISFIAYSFLLNFGFKYIRTEKSLKRKFIVGTISMENYRRVVIILDYIYLLIAAIIVGGNFGFIVFLFVIPLYSGFGKSKFLINTTVVAVPAIYFIKCFVNVRFYGMVFNHEIFLYGILVIGCSIMMMELIFKRISLRSGMIDGLLADSKYLTNRLKSVNSIISKEIDASTKKIEKSYIDFLRTVIMIMEARDPIAFGSSVKTNELAIKIATKMGKTDIVEFLKLGGVLHDIGNIGIPDRLFYSEDKLTRKERDMMKTHVHIAEEILSTIEYFKTYIPMCKHHHEAYNGKGYPDGLKGDDIPIEARTISVADSYIALISDRYFRTAFSRDEALKMIESVSGIKFDPVIVMALKQVIYESI
jgi:hypothetical protein